MVPELIIKDYSLKRLKVNYRKETHYGKKIKTLIEIAGEADLKICRHKIMDEEEDICFLETNWHKA